MYNRCIFYYPTLAHGTENNYTIQIIAKQFTSIQKSYSIDLVQILFLTQEPPTFLHRHQISTLPSSKWKTDVGKMKSWNNAYKISSWRIFEIFRLQKMRFIQIFGHLRANRHRKKKDRSKKLKMSFWRLFSHFWSKLTPGTKRVKKNLSRNF